ncbi:MAG: isoprenylcysteine carboxylmethyltransferase family protein [Armatimonadota bacterium]
MKVLENKIPPPIVMSIIGAAMVSTSFFAQNTPHPAQIGIGSAIIFAGFSLAGLGVREFRKSKTTINPVMVDSAVVLVTSGVFRRTRNPMYLGFAVMLVGLAIALRNPLAFVGPLAFFLYINKFQIGPEERAMERRFGAAYKEYKQTVRRW